MNYCKLCGKPLTLTPEYDYCMECQGRIMREATIPQNSFTTNSTKSSMNIYDEAIEEIAKDFGLDSDDIIIKALERAKKVEELLTYQNHYIDSIIIELNKITKKAKSSQIEIIKKELEETK